MPKPAKGELPFPKPVVPMQVTGLLWLVPAGRGTQWDSWHPPNTPSVCAPGDWSPLPPAREPSDENSYQQWPFAPDGLCWRSTLILNCCSNDREGFWSCSKRICLITRELHGLTYCKHCCCLMLMLKFSSLRQQKVFSFTVLWIPVLENNQSLQKHRSDLWPTPNQDDTGIFHCLGGSLGPVLQTDTQVSVPMKIKWLNLLHKRLQGHWYTYLFSQKCIISQIQPTYTKF